MSEIDKPTSLLASTASDSDGTLFALLAALVETSDSEPGISMDTKST